MANIPTEGDDSITGTGGGDTIDALGGNDVVRGGDGDDRLSGGAGDDSLYGENGDDLLIGNSGSDRMIGGWGDDTMVWNNGDGSDLMEGGHDYDTTVVNGADTAGDAFTINPNGDRVDFDRVNLVPFSLDIGSTEKLEVNGQGGDDTITAGDGLKHLIKLKLDGGAGNDEITGGDGNDWIDGGYGYDTLTGGAGYDSFVFEKGKDVITDFEHGKDTIVIEGYDWIDGYGDIKDRIEDHGDYVTVDLGHHELTVEGVSWLRAADFDL